MLLDGCADTYNPKTVRASMGAVFRTQPVSMTRQQAIAACRETHIPLLATACLPTLLICGRQICAMRRS